MQVRINAWTEAKQGTDLRVRSDGGDGELLQLQLLILGQGRVAAGGGWAAIGRSDRVQSKNLVVTLKPGTGTLYANLAALTARDSGLTSVVCEGAVAEELEEVLGRTRELDTPHGERIRRTAQQHTSSAARSTVRRCRSNGGMEHLLHGRDAEQFAKCEDAGLRRRALDEVLERQAAGALGEDAVLLDLALGIHQDGRVPPLIAARRPSLAGGCRCW